MFISLVSPSCCAKLQEVKSMGEMYGFSLGDPKDQLGKIHLDPSMAMVGKNGYRSLKIPLWLFRSPGFWENDIIPYYGTLVMEYDIPSGSD